MGVLRRRNHCDLPASRYYPDHFASEVRTGRGIVVEVHGSSNSKMLSHSQYGRERWGDVLSAFGRPMGFIISDPPKKKPTRKLFTLWRGLLQCGLLARQIGLQALIRSLGLLLQVLEIIRDFLKILFTLLITSGCLHRLQTCDCVR